MPISKRELNGLADDKGYHRETPRADPNAQVYSYNGTWYEVQHNEPAEWLQTVSTPAEAKARRVAATSQPRPRTKRPEPLEVHDGYVVLELEAILDDKIDDEGNMQFRCKWVGYNAPRDDTWELVDSFQDNPTPLLLWLSKTRTAIPTLTNIEIVNATPQGGYMIRRLDQGGEKQEWYPMKMLPFDMVMAFDAAPNDDLDRDMELDEMDTDSEPDAPYEIDEDAEIPQAQEKNILDSMDVDAHAAVTTIEQPISTQEAAEAGDNSISRDDHDTAVNDLRRQFLEIEAFNVDLQQRIETNIAAKQSLEAALVDAKATNANLQQKLDTYADTTSLDARLRDADLVNVQQAAKLETQADLIAGLQQQLSDLSKVNKQLQAMVQQQRQQPVAPTMARVPTQAPAFPQAQPICTDYFPAGHTHGPHLCEDPLHNPQRSQVSCQACCTAANTFFTPEQLNLYSLGLTNPVCDNCTSAAAQDDRCRCHDLPRCVGCHLQIVNTFVEKAGKGDGLTMGCARCNDFMSLSGYRCCVVCQKLQL